MATIDAISSAPRPQRFWIRCPAPGISQAKAGATTDIVVKGAVSALAGSRDFDLSLVEFAIQMVTISRWIFPVTSARFGRTRMLTSLRTPNSGR